MWEKKEVQGPKFGEQHGGSLGERALPSYRLVPLGTAWDRINFFLRAKMEKKIGVADCGCGLAEYHP
jgi:hypothetical protein